ncbi:MAG: hypothetical protein ACNA8W_08865, partial [Bradymonadaceae bacterium]
EDEIEAARNLEVDALEYRDFLAVAYGRARARANFTSADEGLEREVRAHYSDREVADIDLVSRVITFANRATNTLDGLLARFNGEPYEHSRLVDELVIGVASAVSLGAVVPTLCVWRRQTPRALYRDFKRFSREFVGP